MRACPHLAAIIALCGLGGCDEPAPPFAPELLHVPAATPATGPRLSGGSGEPLVLSWMQENDDGGALLWSRYEQGSWSAPKTVVRGVDMFVNWADMPSVQPLVAGQLAAHWLEMSADMTYAYDVVFVRSTDDGVSWSNPVRPHSDGTPTEHGFVSMFSDGDRTGLIWLDGRKMVNDVTDDPVASGMTLRAAFLVGDSHVQGEQLVDELICDCCQTDVAVAASGPVAVYRDRSVDEIRDIYVTRFSDDRWQTGVPLSEDNWEIPGCPVNGPSIAARGEFVAAAWFTAAYGEPKVKLRFSTNGGESFGSTIDVAGGTVLGRVGVVLADGNDIVVSWLRGAEDGVNELAVQRFSPAGEPGDVHVVASGIGSFSVPQMAVAGDELVFAWTETAERVNSIHSARVLAASL